MSEDELRKEMNYYKRNKIPSAEWVAEVRDYRNLLKRNRDKKKRDLITDEEKARRRSECNKKLSEKSKARFARMTKEERSSYMEKAQKIGTIKQLNAPPEEKFRRSKKLSNSLKLYNSNRSEEERISKSNKHKEIAINHYANMTQEKREEWLKNLSMGMREYYLNESDESKQLRSDKAKYNWAQKSFEEKERISDNAKNRYMNQSELFKEANRNLLIRESKKYRDSMTQEQKDAKVKSLNDGFFRWLNGLTAEEKFNHFENIAKKTHIRFSEMTKDELLEFGNKVSDGLQKYISTLNDEQKKQRTAHLEKWWNDLSLDDFEKIYYKRALTINSSSYEPVNLAESTFMNMMNLHLIPYKYQYSNLSVHPDFYKIFSKRHNPYHVWDFRVNNKGEDILIDIDGSLHALGPGLWISLGIDVGEYAQFNDSKRLYQTDDLDAYVVQCYDDNLTNDTPVLNIKTNEIMTYRLLIEMLVV